MTEVDTDPAQGRVGVEAFVVGAYDAHHAGLFAFLVRATRDRAIAEDLLAATFRRLTREAHAGLAPVDVRGWLYRAATNLVISSARRDGTARGWRGRRGRTEQLVTAGPSAESGVLNREPTAEMERVLAGLTDDARLALLLSGEGFTGEEIATAIGRSETATRTLLWRARARVRLRRALFAEDAP